MPLPESTASTPWPPTDIAPYAKDQAAWAAWWSGDTQGLADTTQGGGTTGRRSFWGRRKTGTDTTRATAHLHATLAADIASTSADLLFGEPPSLLVPDVSLARAHERRAAGQGATEGELAAWPQSGLTTGETVQAQDRLDTLMDSIGLANRLLEAGEVCAATGGVYLRPLWDKAAADYPLLTVVDADRGVPDFRYGQLVAVTFVEEVMSEGDVVWRHLERHEPGVILHGLYVGAGAMLGRRVSLTDHPATMGFMDEVPVPVEITGGRPGIMPRFVPNVLPNRKHRKYPIGRSDYAGCESFLDALDETWTSWMRDLRLGQARLVVPDEFLTPVGGRPGSERQFGGAGSVGGPGSARGFDLDAELFTGLNIADLEKLSNPISQVQFDIRVEQHERTAVALTEHIISTAGYSPQTFGLQIEGRAESGTALRIREGKTWRTQGRKQRYWAPELSSVGETLLALDRVIFGRPTPVARPAIGWQELADDPQGTAQWVNTLASARAASIETRVRLAQPGLDDDQITQEVSRIKAEDGLGLPDPLADPELGRGPVGDSSDIKAKADAMGVLIRAGVEPEDAAIRVGLAGVEFTGAVPVSLRLPTADASGLEQT
ncbi:hypothetical protein [Blastococcus sp. CT_GayMR16]|uniref:hypothetical protein n=1 Tax=Blastococcus sp. CT_GayMR16 TaxID=2559607 RepID=UPI0010749688|nr:hypothetical protein [Blastococcus sp. CT_GayMR16]TFV91395.1 hypothetical protein E4P38_02065 [Blastococcus sp. CT_GayMR16]